MINLSHKTYNNKMNAIRAEKFTWMAFLLFSLAFRALSGEDRRYIA